MIASSSALAVVAPGPAELRDLVAALAAVPVSGVLLLDTEQARGGRPWPRRASRPSASSGPTRSSWSGASSGSSSRVARSSSDSRRCSRRSSGAGRWRAAAWPRSSGRCPASSAARSRSRRAGVRRSSSTRRPRRRAPRRTRRGTRRRPPTAPSRCASRCPRPPVLRARSWCSARSRSASSPGSRSRGSRGCWRWSSRGRRPSAAQPTAPARPSRCHPPGRRGSCSWRASASPAPRTTPRRHARAARRSGGPSGCWRRRAAWRSAATRTASSSASSRPAAPEDVQRLAEQVARSTQPPSRHLPAVRHGGGPARRRGRGTLDARGGARPR